MPRFAYALLAVAVAASVAGCSLLEEDPPARADTIAGEETPDAVDAGSGDTLTAEQAQAALLTVEDLPTGWSVDESADLDKDGLTTKPKLCASLFDGLGDVEPAAEARAAFRAGGSYLEQTVKSWDTDAAELVKQSAAATGECKKFTSTNAAGDKVTFRLSKLSFPTLGDRTLAMRANGGGGVLDAVFVAEGKNTVLISVSGFEPIPGDDLEAVARAAVAKLG